jgi:hypothetical protein
MIDLLLDQDFVDHWNKDGVFFAQLNLQKMFKHCVSFKDNSDCKTIIICYSVCLLVFLYFTQVSIVKLKDKTNVSKDEQYVADKLF